MACPQLMYQYRIETSSVVTRWSHTRMASLCVCVSSSEFCAFCGFWCLVKSGNNFGEAFQELLPITRTEACGRFRRSMLLAQALAETPSRTHESYRGKRCRSKRCLGLHRCGPCLNGFVSSALFWVIGVGKQQSLIRFVVGFVGAI